MLRALRSLLLIWHLSSLDAPLVAVVWTYYLSLHLALRPSFALMLLMFISVWLVYVIDRILDGQGAYPHLHQLRHRFHRRYIRIFLTTACILVCFIPSVLCVCMHDSLFDAYVALSCGVGGYFVLVHTGVLLPKELLVGVNFGVACSLPRLALANMDWQAGCELFLLCVLFSLNCYFIRFWESHTHDANARIALVILSMLACILGLIAVALHASSFALAPILASTCALWMLHATRFYFSKAVLRSMADAVLLSPLLFLFF